MQWSEVLRDKSLRDLPYKIELNEYGQIIMSPASNQHGFMQVEIAFFLRTRQFGKVITECSIDTPKGVKVADVVWGTPEFFKQQGLETPYSCAPELCVEILSPSNSTAEMLEKTALYLQQGAKEVWICKQNGQLEIFNHTGQILQSELFAQTPTHFSF